MNSTLFTKFVVVVEKIPVLRSSQFNSRSYSTVMECSSKHGCNTAQSAVYALHLLVNHVPYKEIAAPNYSNTFVRSAIYNAYNSLSCVLNCDLHNTSALKLRSVLLLIQYRRIFTMSIVEVIEYRRRSAATVQQKSGLGKYGTRVAVAIYIFSGPDRFTSMRLQ